MSRDRTSLEQMHMLAFAAGFGAVSEDELGIQRDVPPDDTLADARAGKDFVPGWHMPDAPAPRTALVSRDHHDHGVTVVAPLWQGQSLTQPVAATWAQHLVSAARGMTSYIPGRGIPA